MRRPRTQGRHAVRGCRGFVSELLVQCGRGDRAARARLFDLLNPAVAGLVDRAVPARRRDDLVAAVFAELWHQAPDFRPGRHDAVGWVLGLATNVVSVDAADAGVRACR